MRFIHPIFAEEKRVFMDIPARRNSNLVIVRAGPQSLHGKWISSEQLNQEFDLIVLAYGPTLFPPQGRSDIVHIDMPGKKVEGQGAFLREYSQIWRQYDRIALIDDDIDTNSKVIARAFNLGREYNLSVWQPSLTWCSHFSYGALLRNFNPTPLRYINFVEMMCPFFSREALEEVVDLFSIGEETAIDVLWSCVLAGRHGALAVLDSISVTHTQPVGGRKYMNGFDPSEVGYGSAIDKVQRDYEVSMPGAVPYAWSRRNLWWERPMIVGTAILTGFAIFRSPLNPRSFLRRWLIEGLLRLGRAPNIQGDHAYILARARAAAAR